MTEEYRSAKEVAKQLGTDARTLRKFLRSDASPFEAVGQGGRYNFDDQDVEVLRKSFQKQQQLKKTPQKPKVIEVEPEDIDNEDLDDEDWMEIDPSDDDLEEIENDET